jgi:hypothetical protein
MLVCVATSSVLITAYFVVLCMDANDVRISRQWCNGSFASEPSVKWGKGNAPTAPPNCHYQPYIIMTVCDGAIFAIWALATFMQFLYLRNYMAEDVPVKRDRFLTKQVDLDI